MPPCARVVTVDPNGAIVGAAAWILRADHCSRADGAVTRLSKKVCFSGLTHAGAGEFRSRGHGTSDGASTLSACGPPARESAQEMTMTYPPDDHRDSVRGAPLEHDPRIINGSMLAVAAFAIVAIGIVWYALTDDRSRIVASKQPAIERSVPTAPPAMAARGRRRRRRTRPRRIDDVPTLRSWDRSPSTATVIGIVVVSIIILIASGYMIYNYSSFARTSRSRRPLRTLRRPRARRGPDIAGGASAFRSRRADAADASRRFEGRLCRVRRRARAAAGSSLHSGRALHCLSCCR